MLSTKASGGLNVLVVTRWDSGVISGSILVLTYASTSFSGLTTTLDHYLMPENLVLIL